MMIVVERQRYVRYMGEDDRSEGPWVRREHLSAELDAESVILSLSDGEYYSLNEVGSVIWQQLETPKTMSELRDSVVAKYDVRPEEAEADIRVLLSDLEREDLIEVAVERGS